MDTFLGHPINYWIELEKHVETLGVESLLKELADCYAKIGFYEKRLIEIADFMKTTK